MKILRELSKDNNFTGREGEIFLVRNIPNDCYYKTIRSLYLFDENGHTHQIDQLLIRPNGVFCIEVKNYKGVIYGEEHDERWLQKLGRETYSFYNPIKQNKVHKKVIEYNLSHQYKVAPLVVFIKNNISNISCDNVISLKDFAKYVSTYKSDITLSNEDIDNIFSIIALRAPKDITIKKHIENIRKKV